MAIVREKDLTSEQRELIDNIGLKIEDGTLEMIDLKNIKDKTILDSICIENFGATFSGGVVTIKEKIINRV